MPRPGDMDTDPNLSRITWLVVVLITPDTPFTQAAAASIGAAITTRTGVAPTAVTIAGDGTALVVLPADRPVEDWVGYISSAMAAIPRTGVVQGIGNRARVS